MTIQRSLLTTALIAAFGVGVPAFAADSHQHAAGEPSQLMLDHGKKWATDEPLRKNMSEIRAALAAKAAAIHKGTLTPEDYKALGALVQAHVANIVTECKLEPAADENLHLIVAELSAGADAMQGKAKVAPAAGAVQTVGAVNQYGRYFKHPGWKPMD
ncbi:hypothetical protein [Candidatus Accumulibacter sp. ACC007]|uniref:hypothetical protein n=1 Tax=Candidatus Accumulibacter sp. ACC007 TaxID=2823333 RepID=UPI0025C210BC|nr:hypothetical protein [Candidatus Accumulibacter sp. ACC007]